MATRAREVIIELQGGLVQWAHYLNGKEACYTVLDFDRDGSSPDEWIEFIETVEEVASRMLRCDTRTYYEGWAKDKRDELAMFAEIDAEGRRDAVKRAQAQLDAATEAVQPDLPTIAQHHEEHPAHRIQMVDEVPAYRDLVSIDGDGITFEGSSDVFWEGTQISRIVCQDCGVELQVPADVDYS